MAALTSDWLRHLRHPLWNCWTEFNETWYEARSQRPLLSLCFWTDRKKPGWPPWPLIGWDIFNFFFETAEQNSTKLDREQDLNVLYQVCVFRADRKNKMAVLASDWLRHLWHPLWNCWTEFNETWQEARSQCLSQVCVFWGWSEKQDGRPGRFVKKKHIVLRCTICGPFGPLVRNKYNDKYHIIETRSLLGYRYIKSKE